MYNPLYINEGYQIMWLRQSERSTCWKISNKFIHKDIFNSIDDYI